MCAMCTTPLEKYDIHAALLVMSVGFKMCTAIGQRCLHQNGVPFQFGSNKNERLQ